MASRWYPRILLIFVCLLCVTPSTYAVDCANGGVGSYGESQCADECPSQGLTCEADDADDTLFCCYDLTQVPELPSWFGPFFLATLVAAWEYWRIHRRKTLKIHAVKKETGR